MIVDNAPQCILSVVLALWHVKIVTISDDAGNIIHERIHIAKCIPA